MSAATKTTLPADQLPFLPETKPVEPLVQCGVLYLGTAPSSAGLRGLDSIQEPFSHRYPVDGTNTVRGIDAVLSVYNNGIQLEFTRQPRVAIFYPLTSLIYCSSVRFSIIENEQTKPTSTVDWRFMPLDPFTINDNKHPPLFCAVVQRTQILPGDECHCFITKSIDASLALVRTMTQVYANLKPESKCLRSPIFYQLDYYGRKLREITGVFYLSPANDDDSQLNRTNANRFNAESITQNYLFDLSLNGFFYRTDASVIDQWQLWDNDDLFGLRPHPPASPFGLHEGLYHDDTSHEVQRYLRHMDDEDHSRSCNYSSKSSSSSSCRSSISTEYSPRQTQHRFIKQKSPEPDLDDTDQFDMSFLHLETSSFEPILTAQNFETKKPPIIIEKVLPKPISSIPILNPILPKQLSDPSNSSHEVNINYIPISDFPSMSYHINERGEKITKEGNRIIFMDVVRPDIDQNDVPTYIPSISRSRSDRKRSTKKHIPVYELHSIERLYDENKSKKQRKTILNTDEKAKNNSNNTKHVTTSDMVEIIDGYFEDPHGHKTKLNQHEAQSMLDHFELPNKTKQGRKNSLISSTSSSKSGSHHPQNHSKLPSVSLVNYEENSSMPSVSKSQAIPIIKHSSPTLSSINVNVNEYVANIYGTAQSNKSNSSSTTDQQEGKVLDQTAVFNAAYTSAFRYMQSSINSNLLRAYHNAY